MLATHSSYKLMEAYKHVASDIYFKICGSVKDLWKEGTDEIQVYEFLEQLSGHCFLFGKQWSQFIVLTTTVRAK